jgi:hypothetical protein
VTGRQPGRLVGADYPPAHGQRDLTAKGGLAAPTERWPGQGFSCSGEEDNPSMAVIQNGRRRWPNSEKAGIWNRRSALVAVRRSCRWQLPRPPNVLRARRHLVDSCWLFARRPRRTPSCDRPRLQPPRGSRSYAASPSMARRCCSVLGPRAAGNWRPRRQRRDGHRGTGSTLHPAGNHTVQGAAEGQHRQSLGRPPPSGRSALQPRRPRSTR